MSHRYLVKLKPLEPFFFGGEFTFGADETRKNETSRYNATSTEFPQQTALLGMLRKLLLMEHGHLTMHKKGEWVDSRGRGSDDNNYATALALVGNEPFSYEKSINLGVIESISPIFIASNSDYFCTNAKDNDFVKQEIEGSFSFGKGVEKAFVFEGFDAKKSETKAFISTKEVLKNYSDFFEAVDSVGIKKTEDKQSDEDGFFRKRSYYPKEHTNASFCFVLEVTQALEMKKRVVTLGADQSSFALEIEEDFSKNYDELFDTVQTNKAYGRIVLNSQTLLTQEAYNLCSFILGERKSYRQLKGNRGKKSKRYYLLEKGSVLFSDELSKLEEALNQAHLQKIGINNYTKIEGKN